MNLEQLRAHLAAGRYSFGNEDELQLAIADRLGAGTDWSFTREHALSKADRIDFWMFTAGIGIEVKVRGGMSALIRQLHRYAQHPDVRGLLLVTSKPTLATLPSRLERYSESTGRAFSVPVESVVVRQGLR